MPEKKGKFGIFAGTQPCSALMTMPSNASVVCVSALAAIPAVSCCFWVITVVIHSVPGVFPPLLESLLMLACLLWMAPLASFAFMLWLTSLLLLGSCSC
jgi:hypothetical protein